MARFDSLADRKTWAKGMCLLKKNDRVLRRLIEKTGPIKQSLHKNYFGTLVRSIISQQISGAAANSILRRLKHVYGGKMPTPGEYLKTNRRKLRAAGLSPQKMAYIRDLSERVENGTVELRKFYELADEDVIRELDEVKGIGRWTAEMFLMFSLGRTDVLPVDDLGFRKAVKRIYRLRELPGKDKIYSLAEGWTPYRSIATIYLWNSSEEEPWTPQQTDAEGG